MSRLEGRASACVPLFPRLLAHLIFVFLHFNDYWLSIVERVE